MGGHLNSLGSETPKSADVFAVCVCMETPKAAWKRHQNANGHQPPSLSIHIHLSKLSLSLSKIHTLAFYAPPLHWVKISWGPASLSSAGVSPRG